jgi:trehalose-phosphatase
VQILNPNISYQHFFDELADSPESLLMLDYDGTLSPFTTDRNNAKPYLQIVPLIQQIIECGRTRVVIISGRSVDILRRLIGDEINCELWGSHGAERYVDNKVIIALKDFDKVTAGLEAIDDWSGEQKFEKYLEIKSLGRAFHWRGESNETKRVIAATVEVHWSEKIDSYGLSMHRFDGGIELRPKNISKANAVTTLLAEHESKIPLAYLGDDVTDEDAFAAIAERGLKVLVRADGRESSADIRIRPPDELITFLQDWLGAVSA